MKNAIFIDIDTDREKQPIMLGKPPEITPPANAEEAKVMIIDDIATVCEALCTLILMSDNSGYGSKEELVKTTIFHLNNLLVEPTKEPTPDNNVEA